MIKSEIFQLIDEEIEDIELKNLIDAQYAQDKWGSSIQGLKTKTQKNSLNKFDQKVAKVFLCRDYNLFNT